VPFLFLRDFFVAVVCEARKGRNIERACDDYNAAAIYGTGIHLRVTTGELVFPFDSSGVVGQDIGKSGRGLEQLDELDIRDYLLSVGWENQVADLLVELIQSGRHAIDDAE
jgi:hypothetical protein